MRRMSSSASSQFFLPRFLRSGLNHWVASMSCTLPSTFRAHRVIVHRGLFHRAVAVQDGIGTEIDFRIKELADERAEGIRFREARHSVAKLEIAEDLLNVRRKSVEVIHEILLKLLLAAA